MARRVSFGIMAEIIDFCQQPRSQTRIMYSINLSYTAVRKYLEYLTSTNMLEAYYGVKAYKATEKGMVFLEKWNELNDFIESIPTSGIRSQVVPPQLARHP